ncbi:hypothetical protein Tco_0893433, partial [Tanacetum coccineum]
MHNNIMAAGSRDRPPMLAPGRYTQWQSRFMRYVDTRLNSEALKKCILQGPYKLSHIIIPGQPTTAESLEVLERTAVKTFLNISPKNKAHYDAEKEVIRLLLTGIGDEIYSNVDACKTAHDMWIAKGYNRPLELPSNTRNKNVDTSPKYKNDNQMGSIGNQSICKECRKPNGKRYTPITIKRCLLCKQAEKGVSLQAEQADWIGDTDEEIDEQELKAHYSFMAKIQEVLPAESGSDAEPLEKVQYDVEYNMFANEKQHFVQSESINDNIYSLDRKDFSKTKSVPKTTVLEGLSKPVTTQILPKTAKEAVRNTNVIKPEMYRIDTRSSQTRAPQLPQTSRNTNPRVSTSTGVIHKANVRRPQLKSTQMKDKVMTNNSQVKFKRTEIEDHHR